LVRWNAAGQIGAVIVAPVAITEAVQKFMDDARARHLGWESIRKYEHILEKRFLSWCDRQGYKLLKHLGVPELRAFRATWTDGPTYATKNLEKLRTFFKFCVEAEWMQKNPALAVKAPKCQARPTLPFTVEEVQRILDACARYAGNRDRMKAFVLVMRYAGLRISDTIRLRRDSLTGNKIFLRQHKTGEPVYVPVPSFVVAALGRVESENEYFFWTGNNMRSAVANWERYLRRVFELAAVQKAHSHRFRDTFSVSLLENGVPTEDVSILLGHSSVAITNKHYAPFVRSRRERLEERVRVAWDAEGAA
jgi:site-specific recombinase XerD